MPAAVKPRVSPPAPANNSTSIRLRPKGTSLSPCPLYALTLDGRSTFFPLSCPRGVPRSTVGPIPAVGSMLQLGPVGDLSLFPFIGHSHSVFVPALVRRAPEYVLRSAGQDDPNEELLCLKRCSLKLQWKAPRRLRTLLFRLFDRDCGERNPGRRCAHETTGAPIFVQPAVAPERRHRELERWSGGHGREASIRRRRTAQNRIREFGQRKHPGDGAGELAAASTSR